MGSGRWGALRANAALLEILAAMTDYVSHAERHEGHEEHRGNENLERSSSPGQKKKTVVGDVIEDADTPAISESRSIGMGAFVLATAGATLVAAAIAWAATMTAGLRKQINLAVHQDCPSPARSRERKPVYRGNRRRRCAQ